MLIAVMVMGLLALFVAATLARVTSEALTMGNDNANTQAFYAAQASLEVMTRNFTKIFDVTLNPSEDDISAVETNLPPIDGFEFAQRVRQVGEAIPVTIEDGPFAGLSSLRDPWRLDTTATGPTGAEVQLTRTFFNNRIPIFQFGIYYEDDMEFHPGPRFDFGGRVHSNGNIFMMAASGLYFRSRVTAVGEVVHDVARNGRPYTHWGDNVYVADSSGVFQRVTQGSVAAGGGRPGGPDISGSDPDMPDGVRNSGWDSFKSRFQGNLVDHAPLLRLPLQLGTVNGQPGDPIELVKRGRVSDDVITSQSRYANKDCIRITIDDAQDRLPGGGIRLDGDADGSAPSTPDRGYRPLAMLDGYQATRLNANRLWLQSSYDGNPRQVWIKVELVSPNPANPGVPDTEDVTADFLSLGVTAPAPSVAGQFELTGATSLNDDNRSIIRLQRWIVPGPPVRVADVNGSSNAAAPSSLADPRAPAGPRTLFSYSTALGGFSYVATSNGTSGASTPNNALAPDPQTGATSTGELAHERQCRVGGVDKRVVPVPIEMFDAREGIANDSATNGQWNVTYPAGTVPLRGVMSIVDIDMANFRRFVEGDFDGLFPNGLVSSDVPNDNGEGWIIYVSDRRGDADEDGEYDFEDLYGPDDGTLQAGEDVNHDGVLQRDFVWESAAWNVAVQADAGALFDHRTFRRGVRLVNGRTLPGTETMGFTLASENGVYILGDYNASGISVVGTPSQPADYTGAQVPASIAADAVTVLSNVWNDGKSFRRPFTFGSPSGAADNSTRRVQDWVSGGTTVQGETTVRTALLMGDSMSSTEGPPHQGGSDPRLAGGVHNFKRFLEQWNGTRLNYCGSLINLFNSRGNDGPFKCCVHIYTPPTRNWVFDTSFLDPDRLPPGTPFFQYIQMTGFRQTLRQLE
jgi:hypothetical protein